MTTTSMELSDDDFNVRESSAHHFSRFSSERNSLDISFSKDSLDASKKAESGYKTNESDNKKVKVLKFQFCFSHDSFLQVFSG